MRSIIFIRTSKGGGEEARGERQGAKGQTSLGFGSNGDVRDNAGADWAGLLPFRR